MPPVACGRVLLWSSLPSAETVRPGPPSLLGAGPEPSGWRDRFLSPFTAATATAPTSAFSITLLPAFPAAAMARLCFQLTIAIPLLPGGATPPGPGRRLLRMLGVSPRPALGKNRATSDGPARHDPRGTGAPGIDPAGSRGPYGTVNDAYKGTASGQLDPTIQRRRMPWLTSM